MAVNENDVGTQKAFFCALSLPLCLLAFFAVFLMCTNSRTQTAFLFRCRVFDKNASRSRKAKTRSIDWFLLHILFHADRINIFFAPPNNIVNCQSLFIWACEPCFRAQKYVLRGRIRSEYWINFRWKNDWGMCDGKYGKCSFSVDGDACHQTSISEVLTLITRPNLIINFFNIWTRQLCVVNWCYCRFAVVMHVSGYHVITFMITTRRYLHNCTRLSIPSTLAHLFTIVFMSSFARQVSGAVNVYPKKKIIGNINHEAIKKFNNASSVVGVRGEMENVVWVNLCRSHFFFLLRTAIWTESDMDYKWIIILIDHVIYFICSCTCRIKGREIEAKVHDT